VLKISLDHLAPVGGLFLGSGAKSRPRHSSLAWNGLGPVLFLKLSKLLNQEDALSVPCLRGNFCAPQAKASCEKARSVASLLAIAEVMPVSAHEFREVVADARFGARPSRAVARRR
jgi:hypothetical protein